MTCATCPRYRRPVPSTGPTPCRVLLLGECPSTMEDKQGIPFVGKTGDELTTIYIPLTNLLRDEFHIANVRLCSFMDYHNPTNADALSCANTHLSTLLNLVKPEIIVPMGAVACSIFEGINLTMHHGIPQPGRWGAWKGWVFPTFHPTAGMRQTAYMIPLMADFKRLGEILAYDSSVHPQVDEYTELDYRVARSTNDLINYFDDHLLHAELLGPILPCAPLAQDTESLPDGSPYCLTFSLSPGTSRLIYAHEKSLIEDYVHLIQELQPLQIFHNYLHDIVPFEEWGIPVLPGQFADTMVMAFNLCLGGGGDDEDGGAGRGSLSLKVLAYRHLAMLMTSFKDTVYPHSMPHMLKWLRQGRDMVAPWKLTIDARCFDCEHMPVTHGGKTMRGKCSQCGCRRFKKWPKQKPSGEDKLLTLLHRKLNTIILKVESGDVDADPWKRIKEWGEWDLQVLRDCVGLTPRPSIAHVPEPELLHYACRDADATIRLYHYLKGLKPWIYYED
jgi:uracil-DNA glycosylase family 4